ncbi:hypothetical protein D3C73_928160 [compost metagenome]
MAVNGKRGQALFGNHLFGRALRQQLAVRDIGQLVAAFGFVHVVCADQHRDAARGQLMQLLPEVAPRGRVHTRRGFVQQQQARFVQQAGGQRHALLPTARQRPRQLVGAGVQAQVFQRAVHRLPALRHAVHARHKVQVFADGQVIPVRELLRHVAHVALDLGAVLNNVVAQAGAAAGIRRQQPAHQADAGGLAAAVGAKKTEDLAFLNAQRYVIDHMLVAKALVQAAHVNHGLAVLRIRGGGCVHCSVASTGCPGCSRAAASGAGRASTM